MWTLSVKTSWIIPCKGIYALPLPHSFPLAHSHSHHYWCAQCLHCDRSPPPTSWCHVSACVVATSCKNCMNLIDWVKDWRMQFTYQACVCGSNMRSCHNIHIKKDICVIMRPWCNVVISGNCQHHLVHPNSSCLVSHWLTMYCLTGQRSS